VQRARRCATADVDLEALAAGYRHRSLSPAARQRAAEAVDGMPAGTWALDVGGGPGTHAAVWNELGYQAVVVDPGAGMTATSRAAGVATVRGLGQRLPFRSATFHLAYFHLSIHYGEWRIALDEARRVLCPEGVIRVWTLGPDHHDGSFLARWFPRVPAIDRRRFPDPMGIADHLVISGCRVESGSAEEFLERRAGDWVAAVRAGFVSTLQFLSPAELAAGLDAFQGEHPDPDETLRYRMRWTWVTARE
jgi:SAM-dependent methyltransferase